MLGLEGICSLLYLILTFKGLMPTIAGKGYNIGGGLRAPGRERGVACVFIGSCLLNPDTDFKLGLTGVICSGLRLYLSQHAIKPSGWREWRKLCGDNKMVGDCGLWLGSTVINVM